MDFPDYDLLDEAQLRAAGGLKWTAFPGCIGAFVAEMDFGTAPPVAQALQQAIADGRTGYPTPALSRELAEACAQWQSMRYGWTVAPERIHAVGDVLGALEAVLAHFVADKAPVVLPTPAYMPFRPLIELHGHPVIEVPHLLEDGRWRMDLDAVDAALRRGAGLVLLCNPQNPTGRVFAADELRALAAVVDRHGARVFSDEIHAPLAGARHVPYLDVADDAVIVTSASKSWNLAALKAGLIVGDPAVLRRLGPMTSDGASYFGILAHAAALTDGRDWLAEAAAEIEENKRFFRDQLAEHLPALTYEPAPGTYLAWLDCAPLGLANPARHFHEVARVRFSPGVDFEPTATQHVRVNLATSKTIIAEAVARLKASL